MGGWRRRWPLAEMAVGGDGRWRPWPLGMAVGDGHPMRLRQEGSMDTPWTAASAQVARSARVVPDTAYWLLHTQIHIPGEGVLACLGESTHGHFQLLRTGDILLDSTRTLCVANGCDGRFWVS